MKRKLIFLVAVLSFHWSNACLWDYDTIEMERRQFPEILEVITGKFLRHTPEFYYWRVQDRTARLKKSPSTESLYDDLAVAYSKLGNNAEAIQLMKRKEEIAPHKYETFANLGTFYIHDGQLQEGIRYINKALAINSEAHFGREVYQKLVIEYVLSKQIDGVLKLPLNNELPPRPYSKMEDGGKNFYLFLVDKGVITDRHEFNHNAPINQETQNAIKGITGMMRFGNYDSPVLLEVLGDLLMQDGDYQASRQLAARAYLKASYQVKPTKLKEAYRKKALFALSLQYTKKGGAGFSLTDMELLFQEELEEAEAFYQQIREDEHTWIVEGKNLDEAFSATYFKSPRHGLREQTTSGGTSEEAYRKKEVELDEQMAYTIKEGTVYVVSAQNPKGNKIPKEEEEEEGIGNLTFLLYLGTGICLAFLLVLRIRFRSLSKEGRLEEE